MKEAIEHLEKLALQQQKKLQNVAASLGFYLTDDDLLQPNDYPQLESNTHFRYEEGVKEGILTAMASLRALDQEMTQEMTH